MNSVYFSSQNQQNPIEPLKNLHRKIIENGDKKSIIAAYDDLAPLLQETIRRSMEHLSQDTEIAMSQEFAEKAIHCEEESSPLLGSEKKAEYFHLFQEAVSNAINVALPPQITAFEELDSLICLIKVKEAPEIVLNFYSSLSLRAEMNIAAAVYDEIAPKEDLSGLRTVGDLREFAKKKIFEEKDLALLQKAVQQQLFYYSSGWQLRDDFLRTGDASFQRSSS